MSVTDCIKAFFCSSLLYACILHAEEQEAKLVEVFSLKSAEKGFPLTLVGHLEPQSQHQATAVIEGVLDALVDIDAKVKKGDVLFRLNTKLLDIELEKLNIEQAQTQLKHKQLLREGQRLQSLAQHQAVTQKELETHQDALAANQLDRQKCTQQIKELAYKRDNAVYKAPFDGVVTEKKATQGQFIRSGEKILQIIHLQDKRIKCIIPDEYSRFLTLNTRVTCAGQDYKIESIAVKPCLKDLGRAVYLKIPDSTIKDAQHNLRFCFYLTDAHFYQVPFLSVQIDVDGPYLMRVNAEQKAERVGIKLINDDRQNYIVTGDIHAGDVIISRGMKQIQTGDRIRTQEQQT